MQEPYEKGVAIRSASSLALLPRGTSNWMLSWLQCGAVIFLWCNLYISMKDWRVLSGNVSAVRPAQGETHEFATQFAIRAGSRIQVIYEKDVLWVSAARDYAELHTSSSTADASPHDRTPRGAQILDEPEGLVN